MQTGLDKLASGFDEGLAGRRVALLADATAVDMWGRHAAQVLRGIPGVRVLRLLAPPHGLWAAGADDEAVDPVFGLPVARFEARGQGGWADPAFADVDAVVCDLRDPGTRTAATSRCLDALLTQAAAKQVPVWVLDRPNPIGLKREGPVLRSGFESARGVAPGLPLRHGLTGGQLAQWLASGHDAATRADLRVVACDRHGRIAYVPPVPRLPSLEAAVAYAGIGLLEATTLSVGLGTTTPYLLVGAPGLDPVALVDALRKRDNPGVDFVPQVFRPTAGPHAGERCTGVFVRIYDRTVANAVATGLFVLHAVKSVAPAAFAWRDADAATWGGPPGVPAIDLLWGSESLRKALDKGQDVDKVLEQASAEAAAWKPDAP